MRPRIFSYPSKPTYFRSIIPNGRTSLIRPSARAPLFSGPGYYANGVGPETAVLPAGWRGPGTAPGSDGTERGPTKPGVSADRQAIPQSVNAFAEDHLRAFEFTIFTAV